MFEADLLKAVALGFGAFAVMVSGDGDNCRLLGEGSSTSEAKGSSNLIESSERKWKSVSPLIACVD